MNKIAMYEALLENHPLWSKEGGISAGLKALKGSRQALKGVRPQVSGLSSKVLAKGGQKMLAARPGVSQGVMKSTPSLRQNVGSLFKR